MTSSATLEPETTDQARARLPEPAELPLESSAPDPAPASVQPMRKPALPALTGLRTVLAVLIMLFHFTPPHPAWLTPVLDNSYVFVGFFFLISGFVLAYNYADRPVLSKRAFYIARLSRVYPVYLLTLVISIPFLQQEFQAHSRGDFIQGLILTPFALQGWSPKLATFWNTVAWTVPAEMMLYGMFPFLLLAIANHTERLRTPVRISMAIVVVWLLGMTPHMTYLLLNPDHVPGPATRFTYAYWLRVLKYSPLAYVCTFSAGVLLARLHAALPLSAFRRSVAALSAMAALGLFFAFGVDRLPYVLIHGALLLPVFSVLLLGLAGSNPVASVFAWRPIVLLGETTFALYLLHFNTFMMIHMYHVPERLHVARFDPWISYAAIMLLALTVFRFYEGPARRFVLSLAPRA